VEERLDRQYRAIEADGNGKALALIGDAVNDKVNELFPYLGRCGGFIKSYDGNAHAQGKAFGSQVDIGAAKLGGAPEQIGVGS
jgi:hypothetical protein